MLVQICKDLGELPYWLASDLSLAYFKTGNSERCMEIITKSLSCNGNSQVTLYDITELADKRESIGVRTWRFDVG